MKKKNAELTQWWGIPLLYLNRQINGKLKDATKCRTALTIVSAIDRPKDFTVLIQIQLNIKISTFYDDARMLHCKL